MSKRKNKPGPISYFVVIALVAIAGLFGWISERDYEYQKEIAELHQALKVAESECAPPFELSMPVELGKVQI